MVMGSLMWAVIEVEFSKPMFFISISKVIFPINLLGKGSLILISMTLSSTYLTHSYRVRPSTSEVEVMSTGGIDLASWVLFLRMR